MKCLIIKSPWIEKILSGEKVWEIRSRNTHVRGEIGLIRSGSGLVSGTVCLVDSFILSDLDIRANVEKHRVPVEGIYNYGERLYAWVLTNPKIFDEPIKYVHPQGAVVWVNL